MPKVSPSAYEKWKRCPAYIHLIEFAPKSRSNVYAQAGTDTHKACEIHLTKDIPLELLISKKDHLSAAKEYTKYIKKLENDCNTKALIENKFVMYIAGQRISGIIDALVINKQTRTAHVIDLKTGTGISVDAYNNGQLILYAIGALIKCKKEHIDIDNFILSIVQPLDFKDESIRSWTLTKRELLEHQQQLFEAIKYNILHATEYYPGYWCSNCDCITICPAMQSQFDLVKKQQNKGKELTKGEKISIIENMDMIEKYMKEVKKGVIEDIKENGKKPIDYNMKWVKIRAKRVPANQEQLLIDLEKEGFGHLIKKSAPTIKDLNENLGKDWVEKRFIKPETPLTLVHINDKRKEINPLEQKLEGFEKEQ